MSRIASSLGVAALILSSTLPSLVFGSTAEFIGHWEGAMVREGARLEVSFRVRSRRTLSGQVCNQRTQGVRYLFPRRFGNVCGLHMLVMNAFARIGQILPLTANDTPDRVGQLLLPRNFRERIQSESDRLPPMGEFRKRVSGIMASILAARKLAQFDGGARVPPQSMQLLMPCDGLNRSWRKSIGVLIVGDSFHARVSDLEQTGLLAIAILAF